MIGTSTGCAAVTSDGDLLIMAGAEVSRARRHIPAYNLACEPGTGMLAAVGDGLVLMNKAGRVVAKARDAVADHVVFLGPDRLVTLDDEGRATIWLHEGRRLLRAMSIDAALNVNRLIALPRHNGILAPNRFTGQASLIWSMARPCKWSSRPSEFTVMTRGARPTADCWPSPSPSMPFCRRLRRRSRSFPPRWCSWAGEVRSSPALCPHLE